MKPLHPLLALESATDALSVALLDDRGSVVLREHAGARQHSAALLAVVDETLRAAGVALGEVAAMAISAGPGSFTSLRIGLATLKGLAFGRSIPVVGISTLEAIALGALAEAPPDAEVLALLDARRGEWYAGAYRAQTGPPPATGPVDPLVASVVEGLYAPDRLASDLAGRTVFGASPEPGDWRPAFEAAGVRFAACASGPSARPRADRVARLALSRLERGEGEPAATLSARYLRRAEAEARRTGQAVEAGETERIGRT